MDKIGPQLFLKSFGLKNPKTLKVENIMQWANWPFIKWILYLRELKLLNIPRWKKYRMGSYLDWKTHPWFWLLCCWSVVGKTGVGKTGVGLICVGWWKGLRKLNLALLEVALLWSEDELKADGSVGGAILYKRTIQIRQADIEPMRIKRR